MKPKAILVFLGVILLAIFSGCTTTESPTKDIKVILNNTGVELKIFRMDTKRNDSEEFGKQARLRTKSIIEDFRPDVVITCDDPAFKYVIMPYAGITDWDNKEAQAFILEKVTNKKVRLYVNLKVAEKLGVIVNPELLKNAEIIR